MFCTVQCTHTLLRMKTIYCTVTPTPNSIFFISCAIYKKYKCTLNTNWLWNGGEGLMDNGYDPVYWQTIILLNVPKKPKT